MKQISTQKVLRIVMWTAFAFICTWAVSSCNSADAGGKNDYQLADSSFKHNQVLNDSLQHAEERRTYMNTIYVSYPDDIIMYDADTTSKVPERISVMVKESVTYTWFPATNMHEIWCELSSDLRHLDAQLDENHVHYTINHYVKDKKQYWHIQWKDTYFVPALDTI